MAYYERGQIEAMSAGLITMRRRSSSPSWFRADDAPAKMLGPCGDNVVRLFEAQDFSKPPGTIGPYWRHACAFRRMCVGSSTVFPPPRGRESRPRTCVWDEGLPIQGTWTPMLLTSLFAVMAKPLT